MHEFPNWDELSDRQRRGLINVAGSFGVLVPGQTDPILISEDQAKMAAELIYQLSRNIIEEIEAMKT